MKDDYEYPEGKLSDQAVIDGTLAWCNEKRKEKGLEPLTELPKGELKNPRSCPCGDATGLYVECFTFGESKEMSIHHLPSVVIEFVFRFDAGRLPQLIKK